MFNTCLSIICVPPIQRKGNSLKINYDLPMEKFRVFELETRQWWIEELGLLGLRKMTFEPRDGTETHLINDCTTEDDSYYFGLISPHQFGLKYCSTIILPKKFDLKSPNFFWLQGPILVKIISEKLDDMKGFSLEIKTNFKDREESAFTITFDAPGTKIDRRIELTAKFLDSSVPTINVHVIYPSSKSPFDLTVKIHDTESLKGISASHKQGQNVPTNYQCVWKLEKQDNGISYQPICDSQRGEDEKLNYIEGSLNRGKDDLNVDLTLTSPFTRRTIILKGLIERPSRVGGLHFRLSNGELAYNNPDIADDSVYSLHALMNGELVQTPKSVGIDMDLKYGKNRPETDLSLKSVISYIPGQTFGIETTAVSKKIRRLNVDFKFLTELTRSPDKESAINVLCSLGNLWNLTAVRKAGSDYGSLDLTLSIIPMDRVLSLMTKRVHVDTELLTQFDLEGSLLFTKSKVNDIRDVGRSEDKIIKVKLGFKREDLDGSYFIQFKKELTIMAENHRVDLTAKYPKHFTNGVYNMTGKYISPTDRIYGLTVEDDMFRDAGPKFSNVSSDMDIQLDLPALDPIFVKWRKVYASDHGPKHSYKILNDFSVTLRGEVVSNITFFAMLANPNDLEKVYESAIRLQGLFVPPELELDIQNIIRLMNKRLVSSSSQVNFPYWGLGKWTLNFVPDREDSLYTFNFGWTPTDDEDRMWPSIDFSSEFEGHLTHILDFKIKSHGSLHLSDLMGGGPKKWGWDKIIEANDTMTRAHIDFSSNSVVGSEFRFKTGFEEAITVFELSFGLKKDFIINVNARTDMEQPYELLIFSISVGKPSYKMWVISVKQEKDGQDIYTPSVNITLPGVSIHLLNVIQNSPLNKRLNSHVIMYVDGMEGLTRSLELFFEKSKDSDPAWNFEIVNKIEEDQTQLKCFGIFTPSGPNSWNGSLEAVQFYGKSGTLGVFLNVGESEKIFYISGNLNGKKQDLIQFHMKTLRNVKTFQVTHEGFLSYPSYAEYRNSYAFGLFPRVNFRVETNPLVLKTNGEDGLEFRILLDKVDPSRPVPDSIVKGDLSLKWTDVEKIGFFQYNYGSYNDLVQSEVSWSNGVQGPEGSLVQKLKFSVVHSDFEDQLAEDGESSFAPVNITSGLLWIKRGQENPGLNIIKESKSLCIVTEKIVHTMDKQFELCTLGFNSNRNSSGQAERDKESSLDLKFALLDRIAFQGLRIKKFGSLTFSSSFWLDSIDKPNEALSISLTKETQEDNLGRQYLFTAKHPFLPKDLKVKLELENDQANKFTNGIVELDIFQEEIDKVFLIVRILPAVSEDDMEFIDMEFIDYEREAKESEPGKFEGSIQSDGLRMLLKFEGSLGSLSGTSYSYLDQNAELQQGKFILKFPSLFDPNILQLGQDPIISMAFRGVPRLEINPLKISNNSIIFEYHGSPHSLRLFASKEQTQRSTTITDHNDYGDEEEETKDDSDNFNFYAVTIPTLTDENIILEFLKQTPELTQSLLNISISLNTSKWLRIENKWNSNEIKDLGADFEKMKSDWLSDLKFNIISGSREFGQNVVHASRSLFNALPSFQRLLEKLKDEFQENLEEIQGDPRSNVIYEFCSEGILGIYEFGKSAMSEVVGRSKETWQVVVDFVWDRDWEQDIRQGVIWIREEIKILSKLFIGKIKESVLGVVEEVKRLFQLYSKENEEFKQIVQFAEEMFLTIKTYGLKVVKILLQNALKLRPYLQWALPKEVQEFLATILPRRTQTSQSNGENGESDMKIDLDNVTSVTEILSKGYKAMTKLGQRLLERKGFELDYVENKSLVIQFPLPKPARILRDTFEAIYSTEKPGSIFGIKYKTKSFGDFYKWITESTIEDSRIPKWSVLLSRIDNVLLGGIGPQDSMALIIDGHYFRTFDARLHNFEPACQYLIAADFLTGPNVTLAIDGESGTLILTHDEENVMIHRNASVEWDGEIVKIPKTESFAEFIALNLGSFKVYRYENILGEVREVTIDHSGIGFACLVEYPVCSIRLKNFLFGRSAGFLGTNNGESFDDFMTPNGEIVGKTSRFYRSWRLNQECKETKGGQPEGEVLSTKIKERCAEIFSGYESPLRPCFEEIPAGDFQQVCETLASQWGLKENGGIKRGICTAVTSYWVLCADERIKMEISDIEECE